MSVGNDVVDLADPETRLRGLHPRFAERVFSIAERDALEASRRSGELRDRLLHWAFWAAKESAYKALKRLAPETVFSPKEFEVDLLPLPLAEVGGVATGRVLHRGQVFDVEVHHEGASVHAVAKSADAAGAGVLWRVERALGDQSVAVRRLAAGAIGSALGLDPRGLQIVRRPPVATYQGHRLAVDLSLSHHGRYVAFACTLARVGRASSRGPCASHGFVWPRHDATRRRQKNTSAPAPR